MKKCPNCGAQINDDNLFCTECGKSIPQGNVCPHCGASVNEGDTFCQNCGKIINEPLSVEPILFDEEKKSGIKKYLPYIVGIVVLLGIIGYFSLDESSNNDISNANDSVLVTDSIEPDSIEKTEGKDYTDTDIKNVVEKMYKELFDYGGYRDFDEKYTSSDYKSLYKKAESLADGPFIDADHWTNSQDSDSPSVKSVSVRKTSDNGATANVEIKLFKDYETITHVKLVLLYEDGKWIVDDFLTEYEGEETSEKAYLKQFIKGALSMPEEDTISEITDNSIDNNYAEYVGRWSRYISYGGQHLKVYTAVIKSDNTAKYITFMPDGSLNTSIDFRQCVFTNGYVFFTDNGDISTKGIPRFKLGTSGLQTTEGERLIKE